MKDLTKILKVGDKVSHPKYGSGVVNAMDETLTYCIGVRFNKEEGFHSFTKEGYEYKESEHGRLSPIINYSKFKYRIGDRVVFNGKEGVIYGYWFSSKEFNNFSLAYGYNIVYNTLNLDSIDKSTSYISHCTFDEYGNNLMVPSQNYDYCQEVDADLIIKDTKMNSNKRNITISLEEAREWYKGDNGALKELALKTFTKEELSTVKFNSFKRGDILFIKAGSRNHLLIYDGIESRYVKEIANICDEYFYSGGYAVSIDYVDWVRKATMEEVCYMFKRIASEGYIYNESTFTLKKKYIPEKGDIVRVNCESIYDRNYMLVIWPIDGFPKTEENHINNFFKYGVIGYGGNYSIEGGYSVSESTAEPASEEEEKEFFDKMHEAGDDFDFDKMEIIPYVWKPKTGKIYYTISFNSTELKFESAHTTWDNDHYDTFRYDKKCVFKTKEEAEKKCEELNLKCNF